jgi:RHS repeat-associated protein
MTGYMDGAMTNCSGTSYYRARYYDPSAGRFLSEDPTGIKGGINYYNYVWGRPNNFIDELGLDGHTWGPITIYTNQQGMTATQIAAEKAHEKQHRCDFWNGNVFVKGCPFLESRGFAAEIPILQQGIQQLNQQKTLTLAEKQELQQLTTELKRAEGASDPNGRWIQDYCQFSSMPSAPNPQYPTPPPCSGFSCLNNR